MDPTEDPRLMSVGGVPLIAEYNPPAPQGASPALALNAPPIEPGAMSTPPAAPPPPASMLPPTGVAGPTHDPGVQQPPLHVLNPGAPDANDPSSPAKPKPSGGGPGDFVRPAASVATGPLMGTTTETTTSRTKGIKAGKAELDALDKSFLAEKSAIDEAAKTGAKQAAEEAGYRAQMDEELARRADLAEDKRRIHERAMAEQEQRVNTAMQDFRSKKIDPEAYWKEKGTGAKITSAIAVALGQLGAGLLGSQHNAALDIINDAVNKNIDAQKEEIANARENVNLEHNLYAQLRQKGLDDREADSAARQLYLEGAQRQLETVAAKYKSDVIKNNAAQLSAQLDQRKADAAVQRSLASQDRVTIQTQQQTAPLKGGAGGAQQLPAGEAAKLGEATAAVQSVSDLQKKYADKAGGFLGWVASKLPFVQNDAKRYEKESNAAAQVVGSYLEGGKLTESDLDRYKDMLPHAGDTAETARTKTQAIVDLVGRRQRAQKEALGASGYNVSGIKDAAPNVHFKKAE